MYVVKSILNFTSHLYSEQPIPICGENEFYYKYNSHHKKIKSPVDSIHILYYHILMGMSVMSLVVCMISIIISGLIINTFRDDNNRWVLTSYLGDNLFPSMDSFCLLCIHYGIYERIQTILLDQTSHYIWWGSWTLRLIFPTKELLYVTNPHINYNLSNLWVVIFS